MTRRLHTIVILGLSVAAAIPAASKADVGSAAAPDMTAEEQAARDFAGLRLGVGLSFTLAFGSAARVDDAEIVSGVVRVSRESSAKARVMLETHYFVTRTPCRVLGLKLTDDMCGAGPFVALQPGTDELITAIGGGFMFGFRRDAKASDSFNIGVGVVCDPNAKSASPDSRSHRPDASHIVPSSTA